MYRNFFGISPSGDFSGVFTAADSDVMIVIAQGVDYQIPVLQLTNYQDLYKVPINSVHTVLKRDMKIIEYMTEISAYVHNKLVWVTIDIARGDIQIEEITETDSNGLAWKPERGFEVPFVFSLATGEYRYLK